MEVSLFVVTPTPLATDRTTDQHVLQPSGGPATSLGDSARGEEGGEVMVAGGSVTWAVVAHERDHVCRDQERQERGLHAVIGEQVTLTF